jgi:hypothetical protein
MELCVLLATIPNPNSILSYQIVTLRDWDVEVSGADAVAEANGNIFKAVPKIAIEVLNIFSTDEGIIPSCKLSFLFFF